MQLIEPQKKYFKALDSFYPGYVEFIAANTVEQNINTILEAVNAESGIPGIHPYSVEFFDFIFSWLRNNKAY